MKYRQFGLIGHPIAHSLSPALFKAGYDGRYPYDLIETADFEEAYRRFLEGYDGINVTAPFKELAYGKADILSEECKVVKATNLLVKTPEGVKAFNSDFLGVRLWLEETFGELSGDITDSKRTPPTSWAPPPAARGVARFSPSVISHDNQPETRDQASSDARPGRITNPTTLVVGLGGAGKAAAAAATSLDMNVILMNRNLDKAESLAEVLGHRGHLTEIRPMSDFCQCFREADIIIYNIPTAIPQLEMLTDEDFAPGKPKLILEANYKDPSFSEELLSRMKKANPQAYYTGGRTWLLYQALTGYEIFTGENPDLAKMSAAL